MGREGRKRVGINGFAGLRADLPAGELLDDRMVITQLDPPHVLGWVVIVRVRRIERVPTTPNTFPEVELVRRAGLLRLVVDAQLDATGRAEHGGFAAPVDAGLGSPLHLTDARDIPVRSGPAMQACHQIDWRLPALQVQCEM